MMHLNEIPGDDNIDGLIDFSSLRKQLEDCDHKSCAEPIKLLKQAVVAIAEGLEEISQRRLTCGKHCQPDRP